MEKIWSTAGSNRAATLDLIREWQKDSHPNLFEMRVEMLQEIQAHGEFLVIAIFHFRNTCTKRPVYEALATPLLAIRSGFTEKDSLFKYIFHKIEYPHI